MITFLEGVLETKQPGRVVLQVHGVGYELTVSLACYERLPAPGSVVRLLAHEHLREDAHLLFGFLAEEERRMFTRLIGVNGVGPKLAMAVLSGLHLRDLQAAVAQGDVKRLSSITGIGKKTAERLVVELRDKLDAGEALAAAAGAPPGTDQLRVRDAILALISLGYKQQDAQQKIMAALPGAGPTAGVEELIRRALAG